MISNFLRALYRRLLRQKGFTLLNVTGLAIGMTAALFIFLYTEDELSFDRFHEKGERVYRINHDFYKDGALDFESARTFPKVGPVVKAEFPEVEEYCRLFKKYRGGVVRIDDKSFLEENLFYADSSFFSVFSYPLLSGDPASALQDAHTGLIEERTALRYFGSASPLGKRIRVGSLSGEEEFEITGVFRSPYNSHLQFNFIFSYASLVSLHGQSVNDTWGWYDFYTYLLLKEGSNIDQLEARLPALVDKYGGQNLGSKRVRLSLEPIQGIHLDSHRMMEASANGSRDTVYFLTILGFAILFIAWINYINLSTARAVERAKEIGIRKTIGSSRGLLIWQFLLESAALNFLAVLLSFVILSMCLPWVNLLTGKVMNLTVLMTPEFWTALLIMFALAIIFSGIYPAWLLSSYKPLLAMKGISKTSTDGIFLRKGLVVGQFMASVLLIAGTITVYRQLDFIQHQPLGADLSNVLVVKAPDVITSQISYDRTLETFKTEMLRDTRVSSLSISSEIPGKPVSWYGNSKRVGLDQELPGSIIYLAVIDYDYFKTYGISLAAGRSYDPSFPSDTANVVINERAVRVFGFKNSEEALQQKVIIRGDTFTIVGVAANYHHESPKNDFRPTAYRLMTEERNFFSLRIAAGNEQEVIKKASTLFETIFPGMPFTYFHAEDYYHEQYGEDIRFMKVFILFASLAIFVACLGLFGLASFTALQRTKEIGIRKVLGSTVAGIFLLLSRDFLKMVIIANVLAIPIIFFLMNQWLDRFAMRIPLGMGIFILSALLTSMVALITVSYQSIRAAMANPVKSLRYE